jgi:hypothetical protein
MNDSFNKQKMPDGDDKPEGENKPSTSGDGGGT